MLDGMEEREERKACDGAKVIQFPRGLNQPIPGHLGQSTHISLFTQQMVGFREEVCN